MRLWDDMATTHKSKKIGKNLYSCPNPKRRISINVCDSLNIVNHKGRWIVALALDQGFGHRSFKANQTINRSQAINIINFLLNYINLVKPTEASALHASIGASTNMIKRKTTELSALALNNEIKVK